MNKLLILGILLLNAICSFSKSQVIIKGKILDGKADEIRISALEETPNDAFMSECPVDSSGNFQTIIPTKSTIFVNLWIKINDEIYYRSFIFDPGEEYIVEFKKAHNEEKHQWFIQGKNEAGNHLLSTFSNASFPEIGYRKYKDLPTLTTFKEKILFDLEQEKGALNILYEEKKISRTFYELACQDRDSYFNMIAQMKPRSRLFETRDLSQLSSELLDYWEQLTLDLRKHYSWTRTRYWRECIESYTFYLLFCVEKKSIESLREYAVNGTVHTQRLAVAKRYLSPKEYELHVPEYLFNALIQTRFEEELLTIHKDYMQNFPNNKYSPFLSKYIREVELFHERKNLKSEKIKIVDGYEKIDDFKSCLALFEGKKLFIDVWATWCGPCKAQFKHNNALKKVLKENGYDILYLSLDTDQNDQQWKEVIQHYQLEGVHIRTNHNLKNDLHKVLGKSSFLIPWYIIIDERGEIVHLRSSAPSNLSQLEKELKETLK